MNFRLSIYAFIAVLIFNFSCTREENRSVSFVQICDPQLGMGGYEHDVRSFAQAVGQINELEPDFAVICGDLVHHASDSSFADFLSLMQGFSVPCYLVPGNHDIGNTPNDSSLNYYRNNLGDDYYYFRKKGIDFIVTNTQLWKSDLGDESEEHDRWFKETLSRMGRKNATVIVIGHYPLYIEDPGEEEKYFNLPPEKRQELLELFVKYNVKAYLSGHRHESVINRYEGILLVTGETTSRNFDNRPLGFRLWNVTPDSLAQQFVALGDW